MSLFLSQLVMFTVGHCLACHSATHHLSTSRRALQAPDCYPATVNGAVSTMSLRPCDLVSSPMCSPVLFPCNVLQRRLWKTAHCYFHQWRCHHPGLTPVVPSPVLLPLCFFFFFCEQRRPASHSLGAQARRPTAGATSSGREGTGRCYKAELKDSTVVAVKRLDQVRRQHAATQWHSGTVTQWHSDTVTESGTGTDPSSQAPPEDPFLALPRCTTAHTPSPTTPLSRLVLLWCTRATDLEAGRRGVHLGGGAAVARAPPAPCEPPRILRRAAESARSSPSTWPWGPSTSTSTVNHRRATPLPQYCTIVPCEGQEVYCLSCTLCYRTVGYSTSLPLSCALLTCVPVQATPRRTSLSPGTVGARLRSMWPWESSTCTTEPTLPSSTGQYSPVLYCSVQSSPVQRLHTLLVGGALQYCTAPCPCLCPPPWLARTLNHPLPSPLVCVAPAEISSPPTSCSRTTATPRSRISGCARRPPWAPQRTGLSSWSPLRRPSVAPLGTWTRSM